MLKNSKKSYKNNQNYLICREKQKKPMYYLLMGFPDHSWDQDNQDHILKVLWSFSEIWLIYEVFEENPQIVCIFLHTVCAHAHPQTLLISTGHTLKVWWKIWLHLAEVKQNMMLKETKGQMDRQLSNLYKDIYQI